MNSVMTMRWVILRGVPRLTSREVGRDLLAIVVELLHAQEIAASAERLVDDAAAALELLPALLHGQLEVEGRLAAPALGDPFRHQPRDARGAVDHVADHEVHRLGGAIVMPVVA